MARYIDEQIQFARKGEPNELNRFMEEHQFDGELQESFLFVIDAINQNNLEDTEEMIRKQHLTDQQAVYLAGQDCEEYNRSHLSTLFEVVSSLIVNGFEEIDLFPKELH